MGIVRFGLRKPLDGQALQLTAATRGRDYVYVFKNVCVYVYVRIHLDVLAGVST
jgi:hypothetical protein